MSSGSAVEKVEGVSKLLAAGVYKMFVFYLTLFLPQLGGFQLSGVGGKVPLRSLVEQVTGDTD